MPTLTFSDLPGEVEVNDAFFNLPREHQDSAIQTARQTLSEQAQRRSSLTIEGIPNPVTVDPSFANLSPEEQGRTVDEIRQAWDQRSAPRAAQPQGQPDTSYSSALRESARSLTSGLGATARVVGNATGSETLRGLGESLSGAVEPDPNYQPATPEVVEAVRRADMRRALSNLPRAVVENAGSLGATLAGGAVGGAVGGPVGAFAGATTAAAAQNYGPNVEERAANNGRQEPSTEDLAIGGLTTAAQSGLEAFGAVGRGARAIVNPVTRPSGVMARGRALAAASGREGASEVADETVQQVGTTLGTAHGLDVDPAEALAAGLIGTGTRGAMGAPGAALRGGLESSVRIAHDVARGELSTEEAASVERVNRLLSTRFDHQSTRREVSPEDLLNGARTELDGAIGRQIRGLRRDGWIGDGEDYSRLRSVFETARRHNQNLAEGNTSPEEGGFSQAQGLRAVDDILGRTPETLRDNVKGLLRDLDTLAEASRRKNLIGPFATLGGVVGRAAAVVGGAAHSGPVGALGGLLGSPMAATIGRRLGGMVDKAGGFGAPGVVLSRVAAQRALRRAGVEEERASTDLLNENDRTIADRAAMRRAVLGLPPSTPTTLPPADDPLQPPGSLPNRPPSAELQAARQPPTAPNPETTPGAEEVSTVSGLSGPSGSATPPTPLEAAGAHSPDSHGPIQRAALRLAASDAQRGALRGWRAFVQNGVGRKGRVATRADIEDAVKAMREDGTLEADEAAAMLAERGRLEDYSLLDEVMQRVAQQQGWSLGDTPDTQLTAARYAGIHSPARWEGARENYQQAASRAIAAGEAAGDLEMVELANLMAVSSESQMSGAARVMRVEALIAAAPDVGIKARRKAYLRPLTARWQTDAP